MGKCLRQIWVCPKPIFINNQAVLMASPALKPEQQRAFASFLRHYQQGSFRSEGVVGPSSFVTGAATLLSSHIAVRSLPINLGWVWSQTRAKEKRLVPGTQTSVEFWKVISRRGSGPQQEMPPLKLWIFHVLEPQGGTCSVLWCELGYPGEPDSLEDAFAPSRNPLDVLFNAPYSSTLPNLAPSGSSWTDTLFR